MKMIKYSTCLTAVVLMTLLTCQINAQDCNNCNTQTVSAPGSCVPEGDCSTRPGVPCPTACNGVGPEGYCIGCTSPYGHRYLGAQAVGLRMHDKYSPHWSGTYGHRGLDATRMHRWNWNQSAANAWHGNYNYWRYSQPTALVVPPTAAFQTEYNWGVAQTRSQPIYHQFSRNYPGGGELITGEGLTSNTPYWPSSTNQFGIYPVRGPW